MTRERLIPELTPEDREEIRAYAREIAKGGEEKVFLLAERRHEILKTIKLLTFVPKGKNPFLDQIEDLYYDLKVLRETENQARVILQMEGRDAMSELDERVRLDGEPSIFSEDSDLGKLLRDE